MSTFLTLSGGVRRLVTALAVSTGVADANKIIRTGADGRLDNSLMPVGIGADTATRPASEALAAGNIVNIWNDASTAKARKADASATGKFGTGFVLGAVSSGANATVYFEGTITGLSGLTPGARYYLSPTTAGTITDTAPSGSGQIVQFIGVALSASELSFEPAEPIEIA